MHLLGCCKRDAVLGNRHGIGDPNKKSSVVEQSLQNLKIEFSLRRKNKEFNESMWDCDGTFSDGSSLFMSGNELTIAHFIQIWKPSSPNKN
jgi:hypothetical protein